MRGRSLDQLAAQSSGRRGRAAPRCGRQRGHAVQLGDDRMNSPAVSFSVEGTRRSGMNLVNGLGSLAAPSAHRSRDLHAPDPWLEEPAIILMVVVCPRRWGREAEDLARLTRRIDAPHGHERGLDEVVGSSLIISFPNHGWTG